MKLQPAGAAVLHLLCDLPPELDPVLMPWWDLHVRELLTLPGFVSARRAHRLTAGDDGRILAVYRLASAEAADQPRPDHFATLPSELEGTVVFNRRVLARVDEPAREEPVGTGLLQLLREPADPASLTEDLARVRQLPGVLSASSWSNGTAVDFHRRSDVRQLGNTDLILAELGGFPTGLLDLAAAELPTWSMTPYAHSFPSSGTVLLPG